jgi:hypothetical protein
MALNRPSSDEAARDTAGSAARTIGSYREFRERALVSRLLRLLGVTLVLGGCGHSIGVMHLYVTQGVPEVNRVLLDVWVAEAQIIGGGLYLAAFRARRVGLPWRGLSIAAALTILAYVVPFIPVLFLRARDVPDSSAALRSPECVHCIACSAIDEGRSPAGCRG